MAAKHEFTTVDFVIFGLSLLASCAIGLFYAIKSMRAKKHTNEDHLLGGRSMPIVPTALSLMSSVVSGILILAYPAEIYTLGTAVCWTMVGCIVALLFTAAFLIPVIYRSIDTVSAYQYFQERFESRVIRIYASLLFTLTTLVYMSVVLYAPAVALSGVTNIPTWVLILVVGILCTAYTSVGGLRAVVWTDAVQAVIMYGGLLAMVVMGTARVGSASSVWAINAERGRLDGLSNVDPNPFQYMTVWTAGIGGAFYWLNVWGVNQMSLQRYVSMPSRRDALVLVLLTIPAIAVISVLCYYMGLVMFAYYEAQGCDPLTSHKVDTKDQLVMYFMIELFGRYPGLPGLFLACLFSGTLSTVSSGVNSLSAVGWQEFARPLLIRKVNVTKKGKVVSRTRKPSDRTATIWTKAIGCVYGAVAIGMAFLAEPLGGIFEASNATLATIGGPLTGLLLLGVFFPSANAIGSFVGLLCGTAVAMWIFIGAQVAKFPKPLLPVSLDNCTGLRNATLPTPFASTTHAYASTTPATPFAFADVYRLGFFAYPIVGIAVTMSLGLAVSLCTGRSETWRRRPELYFHAWWKVQPEGRRERKERRRREEGETKL